MAEGKKILIVDDEADLASMWQMRLKGAGYDVQVAGDGTDALTRIKSSRPDLIVADVVMPEMDGFTLFKELKRNQQTADIPIIIVTGRKKMADSFAVLGVTDFLVKPFDAKSLLDKIEAVFLKSVSAVEPMPELIKSEPEKPMWNPNWAVIIISGLFLLVFGGALFLIIYVMSSAGAKEVPQSMEYSQGLK